MNKSNVIESEDREGIADPLRELLREGAQQLIRLCCNFSRRRRVT